MKQDMDCEETDPQTDFRPGTKTVQCEKKDFSQMVMEQLNNCGKKMKVDFVSSTNYIQK